MFGEKEEQLTVTNFTQHVTSPILAYFIRGFISFGRRAYILSAISLIKWNNWAIKPFKNYMTCE